MKFGFGVKDIRRLRWLSVRIEEWFALLAILGTTSAGEIQRQDDITHVNREGGRIKWVGGDTDATLYKAAD